MQTSQRLEDISEMSAQVVDPGEMSTLTTLELRESTSPSTVKRRFDIGPVLVDALIIASLAVLSLTIPPLVASPHVRGLFCSDYSIDMPRKEDPAITGGTHMLIICVIIAIPICVGEITRIIYRSGGRLDTLSATRPDLVIFLTRFLQYAGSCVFGLVTNYILWLLCAYTVGRLRPNFLRTCVPVFTNATRLCGRTNNFIDPAGYKCSSSSRLHSYARLSFFCIKSSSTMHCAVFTVLYLEARLHRQFGSRSLRPLIQTLLICAALMTGSATYTHFESHSTDLIVGYCIGTLTGVLSAILSAGLFVNRKQRSRQPVEPVVPHSIPVPKMVDPLPVARTYEEAPKKSNEEPDRAEAEEIEKAVIPVAEEPVEGNSTVFVTKVPEKSLKLSSKALEGPMSVISGTDTLLKTSYL